MVAAPTLVVGAATLLEDFMTGILITGSSGLVGHALRRALEARGHHVRGLDLRSTDGERGDVRDRDRVDTALRDVTGIVHLAAISRVVWGERDPATCWSTNVDGLRNVLERARSRPMPPWLIFASSREVYGQPDTLPACEGTPLRPVNVYGRSKVAGEQLVEGARIEGLRASIVRLSNVYGSTRDHPDRVVPAFARAAVSGAALHVEGPDHTFDFTHLDDTTRGIAALVDLLASGRDAPLPVHFVTGQPTTLARLARLAIDLAGSNSAIEEASPRSFDVSRFYGSPAHARTLLDWSPRVGLHEGLARLIEDFRIEAGAGHQEVAAS